MKLPFLFEEQFIQVLYIEKHDLLTFEVKKKENNRNRFGRRTRFLSEDNTNFKNVIKIQNFEIMSFDKMRIQDNYFSQKQYL